jgi:hypothetical protein
VRRHTCLGKVSTLAMPDVNLAAPNSESIIGSGFLQTLPKKTQMPAGVATKAL